VQELQLVLAASGGSIAGGGWPSTPPGAETTPGGGKRVGQPEAWMMVHLLAPGYRGW
jgi:hypothetical protein